MVITHMMNIRGLCVIAALFYLVMLGCLVYCIICVKDAESRIFAFSALSTFLMMITMVLAVCVMNVKGRQAVLDKYEELQEERSLKTK